MRPLAIHYLNSEVQLKIPPAAAAWLGTLASGSRGATEYTNVGLVAIGMGWPDPPWAAAARARLQAAEGEEKKWASYLSGAAGRDPQARAEALPDLRKAVAAVAAARAELELLTIADVPRAAADRQAAADAVRAWLGDLPAPVVESYGVAVASALESQVAEGWGTYAKMCEEGFSAAPGNLSYGASEPAAAKPETPSAG